MTRTIQFANQHFVAHASKVLYWEEANTLLCADIHFGKPTIFRKQGVPIPEGACLDDMKLLNRLCGEFGCERLIILGDLIHAALTPDLDAQLRQALDACPVGEIRLVLGNHDKQSFSCEKLQVCHDWHEAGYHFVHEPPTTATQPTIAGHIHPTVLLQQRHQRYRVSCFVIQDKQLILPSFGSFTGGYNISKRDADVIYPIAGDRVFKL